MLLSGDRMLCKSCRSEGIETHGIIWVLDHLVDTGLLSKTNACDKLNALLLYNAWLPKEECDSRLAHWSGQPDLN